MLKVLTICENYSNLEKFQQSIICSRNTEFCIQSMFFAFKYVVCIICLIEMNWNKLTISLFDNK